MNKITLVVDASKSKACLDLSELFRYRDLFVTFTYRDYRVRYAQTALGFLWAFIKPFASLLIAILIFGVALNVDTGSVPYPLFAACGIMVWTYFSFVLTTSGTSIINAQNIIKKIYFPRLILPISKACVGFVDFFIAFLIVMGLFIYYDIYPSVNIWLFPFIIIMSAITSLGVGIWLSALTIRFRDFQQIVPFIVQFGLYLSPVMFPSNIILDRIPEWGGKLYYLNPVAGLIDVFRYAFFGTEIPVDYFYLSFLIAGIFFVSGLYFFKHVERHMADII